MCYELWVFNSAVRLPGPSVGLKILYELASFFFFSFLFSFLKVNVWKGLETERTARETTYKQAHIYLEASIFNKFFPFYGNLQTYKTNKGSKKKKFWWSYRLLPIHILRKIAPNPIPFFSATMIFPQLPLHIHCCAPLLQATKNEELRFSIIRSNQSHVLNLTVITILSPSSCLKKGLCLMLRMLLLDLTAAEWWGAILILRLFPDQLN